MGPAMALKIKKDHKNALNWTAPPNPASLLAEKIVHYVTGAGIHFLPYVEVDAAETSEMRRNYRTMWREPSIAAALDSMIFGTMSLDWNVLPADASEPMDRRNADWLRWNFEEPGILRGGVRNLISSILVGALIEGISVSQKVFEPTECRKWGMKLPLTELRPIDPDDYELQEDHNRKITAVLSRIGYRRYEPDNFVIWSYMPLYGSARGHAILRRVTREFWIIDTAMKFHRVGLERFVLPWFKALGPADQHDALEKASRQLGALGYFIGTSDMTVEAMQLSLEGEKFENAIRLYMNRIMLGLTGAFLQATEGQVTGARSIGEVHQQSAELGAWYRQSGVEQAINEHLVPQIVRFNFADGGLPKIRLGGVNDEWQARRLVIFQGAWNMGLRISAKQVQDELGLQAPMDASDELKQQPALGGGLGLPGFSDQAAAPGVGQDDVASAPSRNPLAVGAAALQQSTNYTCGPVALLMALAYFGKDDGETEQTLAAEMGTTPENGTAPEAIAQAARVRGLNVATRQQMSMEALEAETVQGKLVICPIQAHGTTGEMQQLQAGHYVVVSRSEEDVIQFLDPSVPGGVAMDKDDFAACWIDQESDGGLYVRYGIILSIGSDELQCQDGPNKVKPGPCPTGTDSEKPSKPVPIDETKAGKAQTDNTALAGPDGRAIAELMAYTIKRGTEVLANVTEDAVKRLLSKPSPGRVQRLFNDLERKEIADSLAMTLAPADLLGRARMRLWFAQAEERAEKKRIKRYADVPTDMAVFVDTLQPLPPMKALEYFRDLVPTIGVDPATFVDAMGQRAFTLCVATDQLLLDRVKQAIQETLEYGTASGPQRIQAILDQAGVSQRNPAYAENVFRTNLKTAYNEGADAERQDPDIADYIPCWRFVGIRDGRQRMRHEIHFDKFYPNSATFAVIRDAAAGKFDGFNCRCDQIPIHRVEWERLENAGAKIEQTW